MQRTHDNTISGFSQAMKLLKAHTRKSIKGPSCNIHTARLVSVPNRSSYFLETGRHVASILSPLGPVFAQTSINFLRLICMHRSDPIDARGRRLHPDWFESHPRFTVDGEAAILPGCHRLLIIKAL